MNNSFFSNFTPKEPKFFPILRDMANVIVNASELMVECVSQNNHEKAIEYYKKIKEQEKNGDKLSTKIFDELNSTFITPFDREDIHHLADKLDDVTDYINSSAKKIMLYNPKQLPASAAEIATILLESGKCIIKAVDELDSLKKSPDTIKKHCEELKVLENKADDVYDNFLIDLFENQKDAVEVIKLKEIMSGLEKATDAAEHVGKIIKTIIVKYA